MLLLIAACVDSECESVMERQDWSFISKWILFCFFFFQAEDGIRDYKVTGVQTCALPISLGFTNGNVIQMFRSDDNGATWMAPVNAAPGGASMDKQWHVVDNFAGTGNGDRKSVV